jgi:hypothetical protein
MPNVAASRLISAQAATSIIAANNASNVGTLRPTGSDLADITARTRVGKAATR